MSTDTENIAQPMGIKKLVSGNKYHDQLLQDIIGNSDSIPINKCMILCQNGKVNVPIFLLQMVYPTLSSILADFSPCDLQEDVVIICPFLTITALNTLKQLITTGKCAYINCTVLNAILSFCPNIDIFKMEYVSNPLPILTKNGGPKFQNILGNSKSGKSKFQNVLGVKTFQPVLKKKKHELEIDPHKSLCNKSCELECYKVVKNWPSEEVDTLRNEFKCDKIIDMKRKLLQHLIVQDRVSQKETMYYKVKDHEFCTDFFAYLIGCPSLYIAKSVLKDFLTGTRFYMHGNGGSMKINSAASLTAISWLKCFSECYGQYSPEENVTVLSYWLSKQTLYKMYIDETNGTHISQSSFYELFNSTFGPNRIDKTLPWIRISKYSTHSVCKICVALNTNQRQCKTEAELQANIDAKNRHRENFGQARRKIEEIKQSALSFPKDHLFVQIDSMDNSKSYLPRYLENSKDQIQKERLPTKITGCTLYSGLYEENRKVLFFLNHDVFENASNMIVSLVYHLLLQFLEDHKFLPR